MKHYKAGRRLFCSPELFFRSVTNIKKRDETKEDQNEGGRTKGVSGHSGKVSLQFITRQSM